MKKLVLIIVCVGLLSGCGASEKPKAPSPTPKAQSTSKKEEKKYEKPSEQAVKAALEAFEVEVEGRYGGILVDNGMLYSIKYFVGSPKNIEITSLEATENKQIYLCGFVADFSNEYIYLAERNNFSCDVVIGDAGISIGKFAPEEGKVLFAKPTVTFDLDCIYDYGKEIEFYEHGDTIVKEKIMFNRENVPKVEIFFVDTEEDFEKEYGLYFTLKDGRVLKYGLLGFDYVEGKWVCRTIGPMPIVDKE